MEHLACTLPALCVVIIAEVDVNNKMQEMEREEEAGKRNWMREKC